MRTLTRADMDDIIIGAALLGAGGGGSPEQGKQLIDYVLSIGGDVNLVSPEEVNDDSLVAVVGGMGSPVAALEKGIFNAHIRAFEALEKAIGKRIEYVIPLEIGAGNSIGLMAVPAKKGLAIIDGDGAGRAVPELQMTTFAIYGVPISPFALANEEDVSVIVHTDSALQCENVARAVCTSFGMVAGFATYAMTGKKMKELVIPNTISLAQETGHLMRTAGREGEDLPSRVAQELGGYVLARGLIKTVETKSVGGFDFGVVVVEDVSSGKPIQIDFKNENMICWKDKTPLAMVPDPICMMTADGRPLTNADVKEGLDAAVLGFKAHAKWRRPDAIGLFTSVLKQLGYAGDYVPIEELVEK